MNWPSDFPNKHDTIPMTNNNYLAGYLEQSFRNFYNVLEREDIIKWNTPKYKKVMDLIDKEIKRAYESERSFSLSETNR
jgi:hypothetical protein